MSSLTDWMDKCHKLEAETEKRDAFDRASISRIELLENEITALQHEKDQLIKPWHFERGVFIRNSEENANEIARLKEWNQERAGQFAATEQRLASRIAELEPGHNRYEFIRRLSPKSFSDLWAANIRGEGTFDDLVDKAIENERAKSP